MSVSERHAELADFSLAQAMQYKSQHNYLRAFPHYLVFAQLEKQKFQEGHVPDFLNITHTLATKLEDRVDQYCGPNGPTASIFYGI